MNTTQTAPTTDQPRLATDYTRSFVIAFGACTAIALAGIAVLLGRWIFRAYLSPM